MATPRTPKQPKLATMDKIELIAQTYTRTIEDYCKANRINIRTMAEKLLTRKSAVRVAKLANFKVSGVPINEILTDSEDLYHCTNKVYGTIRDWTEVSVDSIIDDELLAKLQS